MSKSQKQGPKQGNTLFAYFTKTPKKETTPQTSKEVLSPRRSPNNKLSPTAAKTSPSSQNGCEVANGDVVWAKLAGYPWWPSLVCNHPTANTFNKGGKKPEIHVQFFDNPPTRAWVKASNVKPFKGSDAAECQRGGQFYTLNSQIRQNAEEADKALEMPMEDRLKLVAHLQPSDSEEEEAESAEMMDLDPDIFDAEMSDENDGSIKENKKKETSTEASPAKKKNTPSKKRTRATRHSAAKPKRRRIMEPDSAEEDSGDDFKPSGSEDDDESCSSGVDENDVSGPESSSEPESPVKKTVKKKTGGTGTTKMSSPLTCLTPSAGKNSFQPSVSSATKSKLSLFSAPDSGQSTGEGSQSDCSSFLHNKLDFLQPDKIRDASKKMPSDPDYDPRTLYVPETFLNKQTPGMRQWWEMKSQHHDTVLFFKMGKFYELFHMDSTVGVEELGLMYMKGEHAHSGFPEIAYSRYADALIQKGYKVARVEQTETPEMMADRCREMARPTKFDRVVKREICQVSTQGIRSFSHRDGDVGDAQPSYLLALCEAESQDGVVYGVCFVDTSIGTFHVGQFSDDRHCSRLRTVFAHHTPAQILYERGRMSQKTLQLINGYTGSIKEALSPGKEFWESSRTLKTLLEENYFKEEGEEFRWPDAIKAMMSDSDSLGLTAADGYDLAVRSLGAVVWYLQYSLMDHEVLSMMKFEQYLPFDRAPEKRDTTTFSAHQRNMVLDGVTLFNLEVTENASTGSTEGTLLEQLDTCSTPFGKRLLKQWVCAPLCQPASIEDRLDAVETLMEMQEAATEVGDALKKMPDLERLLSRIHSLGSAKRSANHPEGRAVMYEEVTYSKRKIEDFLATLGGFKTAMKIVKKFSKAGANFRSKLLKHTVLLDSETEEGRFPDLTEDLEFFEKAFNHEKARKDGVIIPSKGVDDDFDTAMSDIRCTETELQDYLEEQRKRLGCKMIVYWGSGRNRFQMEVPEAVFKRVPEDYELMSSKKGAKRYRTSRIDKLFGELSDAEERKDACLKDIMRRIFHSFDERYQKWNQAVACLAVLDVLLALSRYSGCSDGVMCRPRLTLPSNVTTPFLEIQEGRHPCIGGNFVGSDFIPNDIVIGKQDSADDAGEEQPASRVVMVTGPNMGGKSTLMRQTGLIVLLSQLGCYVPAEKCHLTPVDRIFTRLGASDKIMSGESTFFVELSETSSVLQHATEHSLVLMDELGRGTATYDGTAIAYAVVQELSTNLRCRSLFSTHYHSLVDQFAHDANVRTGHMACMVENEEEGDPSQETITFLYKFTQGACPKSYGFNAARLASIPEEIICGAIKKAKEFESNIEQLQWFRKLWRKCTADNVHSTLDEIPHISVD
ncbi:DNA mismatch repair protein Msh6-like [Babylonia areolata]|uniref:DNA mismatch repair protein Msh6-like n=1 Tax=Babylonia areolata TaxID=304850 RepID=UPI003FD16D42